jgi:phosphomethylpyrimidine synthase
MKIMQDVRDYAAKQGIEEQAVIEAGMREKVAEFVSIQRVGQFSHLL